MPLDEQPESTKATKWAALFTRIEAANRSMPSDKQVEIPEDLKNYYMGSRTKGGRTGQGSYPEPTKEHTDLLKQRQDAQTKKHFDVVYGPGSADKILWGE